MAKPWMPSEQDRVILQDLINIHKGQLGNTPSRPPTERSWDEAEDHQAPEVYIAKPQTSAGIPQLLEAGTGTGTDVSGSDYDEPGKAECDIYKILVDSVSGDPELHSMGFTKIVHNLSSSDVDQDWILVTRTKAGKWIAVPTAVTVGDTEWAKLDETLYEGETATASIWRGGPKVADLTDSGENVTVGAPPLMGDDDTGTAGETIASGSWVLIEKINGYWWVIGVPC